ncbi:MAG: class I SAM-dependent methyltransferase [Limisphaerales bacterium]
MPPYKGPKGQDDLGALLQVARSVLPKVAVELGTAHGNLTANLCRQCPDVTVYTVDAPAAEQTGEVVTYSLSKNEIGRVYRRHGYSERVVQIFENTLKLDLSRYFQGPSVGLGIIDACHDAEYVMNDFRKLTPFIEPGAIILLHDTDPSMEKHLRGSYMACMRLRRNGFDIKQLTGTWWGVWVKPPPAKARRY